MSNNLFILARTNSLSGNLSVLLCLENAQTAPFNPPEGRFTSGQGWPLRPTYKNAQNYMFDEEMKKRNVFKIYKNGIHENTKVKNLEMFN